GTVSPGLAGPTPDPGPDARGALSGLEPAANAITGAIQGLGYTGVAHGEPAQATPGPAVSDPFSGFATDPGGPFGPAGPAAYGLATTDDRGPVGGAGGDEAVSSCAQSG